jgi:hypothetical protein
MKLWRRNNMSNTIKVKATWEFEFDAEGYDSKFVDIVGLAKYSAKSELTYLLYKREIQASDFKYTVADGTKYGEVIQLPPEEMARWICCPDMFDDNFIKPDCNNADCTKCCLDYLHSRVDNTEVESPEEKATSEGCNSEKQPQDVAITEENIPPEMLQFGTEDKMERWTMCDRCKRRSMCALYTMIREHLKDNYLAAVHVSQLPLSLRIKCDMYYPDQKYLSFGYEKYPKEYKKEKDINLIICDECDFKKHCNDSLTDEDRDFFENFIQDICEIDDCLSVLYAPECHAFVQKYPRPFTATVVKFKEDDSKDFSPTVAKFLNWFKKGK